MMTLFLCANVRGPILNHSSCWPDPFHPFFLMVMNCFDMIDGNYSYVVVHDAVQSMLDTASISLFFGGEGRNNCSLARENRHEGTFLFFLLSWTSAPLPLSACPCHLYTVTVALNVTKLGHASICWPKLDEKKTGTQCSLPDLRSLFSGLCRFHRSFEYSAVSPNKWAKHVIIRRNTTGRKWAWLSTLSLADPTSEGRWD